MAAPTPGAAWKSAAPRRRGRSPRRARRGCKEAKRRLEEEHRVEARRQRRLRGLPRRAASRRTGGSCGAVRRSRLCRPRRRRARSTPPTWTRATSRRRAGGCRATTPRPSPPSDQIVIAAELTNSLGGLRAARADGRRRPRASWRRRRRATARTSCSPTPATGTRSRCSALAADGHHGPHPARRQQAQRRPARAGTAGSTPSCAASWPPPAGGALYAKRQGMIEPVFADTKFNRKIDRFLRRGRAACRSEWRVITATHNLLKLWRATSAPRTASTGRPRGSAGASAQAPTATSRHPSPSATLHLCATASGAAGGHR